MRKGEVRGATKVPLVRRLAAIYRFFTRDGAQLRRSRPRHFPSGPRSHGYRNERERERERARNGPGKPGWVLMVLGLLAFTPALMGANCSPSRPRRSLGLACTATGGITCGMGANGQPMLPTCINSCVQQPPVASAEGARCVVDPCNATGFAQANTFMCPANFGCVANAADPGFGNCRMSTPDYGAPCDVDGSPPCPTQSYCRVFSAAFPRPMGFASSTQGACVMWQREGNLCNGNWDETVTTDDRRCEPGTLCLATLDPVSHAPTGPRRCQRQCTSDNDCPCSLPSRPVSCNPGGGSINTCTFCMPNGAQCDLGVGCCDTAAQCTAIQGVPGVPAGTLQCCHPNGTSCSSNADCCGNSRCNPADNKCTACSAAGNAPGGAGCCPGLVAITHSSTSSYMPGQTICSAPCTFGGTTYTEGTSCTPPGGTTGCNHRVVCRSTGFSCEPSPQFTTDTSCDNMDQDCDRMFDDDFVGASCTNTVPAGTCQSGFASMLTSTNRCNAGVQSCRPVPYCRNGPTGVLVSSSAGGRACESSYQFCTVDVGDAPPPAPQYATTNCQPFEACGPDPLVTSTCGPATAGCCAFRRSGTTTDIWRPCCRHNNANANRCWIPTTL